MNAKTTKFFAMLAVLAVAFAGVAVLVQEQTADAAAGEAVTKATYDDAVTAKVFTSIKLETTENAKSVVLYQYGTTPTVMKAGMAYFFAESSNDTVKVPVDVALNKPIMAFVLDDVTVKFDVPEINAPYGMIQFVAVSEYDADTGIITLAEEKDKDSLFNASGYAYGEANVAVNEQTYAAPDRMISIQNNDDFAIIADLDVDRNFIFSVAGTADLYSDTTITGDFEEVNLKAADGMKLTLVDFNGKVIYDDSTEITLQEFTGVLESVPAMDTPLGEKSVLVINKSDEGLIKETSQFGLFVLADDVTIEFAEGATIGGVFGYVDEYGDWHAIAGSTPMKAGLGGFSIYSGDYMIGADGTAVLDDTSAEAQILNFVGNVVLSGMIYTEDIDFSITKYDADNDKADVKLAGLQVVGDGAVTLDASVLVLADTSFYVKGSLEIASGAVLKVAEGAVVKAEGDLTMGAAVEADENEGTPAMAAAAIWNAGQVVVPNYIKESGDTTTYYDAQLIKVYMNSTEDTGKFFAGSTEYDGTTAPLAVAYGAYIDITGKCSVNLTSNNITVENSLYKYWTMILATKNTTIPLTVDYPNQYPATISLEGKDCSSIETTAKSATFRNVVWETPSVAFIYITAPEVYEVKLVEVIDETTKATDNAVTIKTPVMTGVTFTDQKGRVITPDADGIVALVFDYKYTIQGATSTSKYKFNDYFEAFEDLTVESKTKATFTMIRNPSVYVIDETDEDSDGADDYLYAVLQITEGKAAKIIVTVTADDAKKLTDGQDFLYYKVDKDGKEIAVPYVAGAGKTVITGIYSNDEIYFKAADVDFYKFEFGEIPEHKDANPEATEPTPAVPGWQTIPQVDAEDETDMDIPTDGWTAVAGITGLDGAYTETTGGVELPIVVADDFITIKGNVVVGDATAISAASAQTFKITWVKSAGQKTQDPIGHTEEGTDITLLADEIITITWDDIDDVRQTMTILGKEYTKGTEYTVSTDLTDVEVEDKNITLKLDKIEYAQVQNSTEKDFTVVCGEFTTAVAKGTIEKKAAEVVTTEITAEQVTTYAYTIDLTLQLKGQSVVSWTYTVLDGTDTSKVLVPSTSVVGESATIAIKDVDAVPENCIVKITNLSTIYNPYIVKTQPVEHAQLGDYSRVGHMDDRMFVYVSADPSYNVADVLVYYEDPANEGFPDYERGIYYIADKSADGKYWTYFMPAENVVLMPQVQKAFYDVTLVDETGAQIGDKIQVAPGTEAVIEIPVEELMYVVSVEPTPAIADFDFEDGVANFTMPASDVTLKVTYAETEYSKNVLVTVGQEKNGAAINVVLYALDDKEIGSGEVTFEVWYTYIDEFGDISVDCVEVTLAYEANDQTVAVLSDETFIDLLGENYSGAYAITGEYVLGAVEGVLSTTAYIPVEA